jgi:chaperonin cofactor prefoldin
MFSPSKKIDKELLLEIANTIELLVKSNKWDLVEELGKCYETLEAKIQNYDYSQSDEIERRVEGYFELII